MNIVGMPASSDLVSHGFPNRLHDEYRIPISWAGLTVFFGGSFTVDESPSEITANLKSYLYAITMPLERSGMLSLRERKTEEAEGGLEDRRAESDFSLKELEKKKFEARKEEPRL